MFAKSDRWILGVFLCCISTTLFAASGPASISPDISGWHAQFLTFLTNPNIAYLLLLFGIYGLFFEALNPGIIFPGILGGICLILALYAFHLLPVNYVGLGLILLGIIFLATEAFLPSGIMAIGGIIAFVFGSMMLFDENTPGFGVALSLIWGITVTTAFFFVIVIRLVLKSRHRPIVSGAEPLINSQGKIVKIEPNTAWVRVNGEIWQAQSDSLLQKGEKVIITSRKGLVLFVKHAKGRSS